jgi:fatty-acyl-CoA synthase
LIIPAAMHRLKDHTQNDDPAGAEIDDSGSFCSKQTILDALQDKAGHAQDVFCHFPHASGETIVRHDDLRREAARYAHYFQKNGVRPGEVVLIILRHSPDLFYSFLGAMLAGAIPSFMPCQTSKQDSRLYWSSHQKLFDRIGPCTLLTYGENLDAVRKNVANNALRLLDSGEARNAPPNFTASRIAPEQVAFLQHSSGTTGLKKGVALSHAAVLRQVASYANVLKLSPGDRIVSWLPLYHDMGLVACFLLPLITHTPVVMVDPFEWVVNPSLLFAAIKQHRGTLCWQPNFAFHHLCRTVRPSPNHDLSSVRAWINCSEPCRAETFQLFAQTFQSAGVRKEHLQVCYAMAESVFAATQTAPGESPRVLAVDPSALRQGCAIPVPTETLHQALLSTGPSIPGMQIRICDDKGAPLSDGSVGEICLAGDCLFDGYYKLDEETCRKLRKGWYHTGDLGFLYEGELYVTGRKNDLIIVHGRNYYAHELEYIVNQVSGVHPGRNVAAGWFRPEAGTEEVIIIAEIDTTTDHSRLVQDIKQRLLDQAGLLVFDVHLVNSGWLVKTTSGKISRVENLNKYLAAISSGAAS